MNRNQARIIVYGALGILTLVVLWQAGYFTKIYESWVRLFRFAG